MIRTTLTLLCFILLGMSITPLSLRTSVEERNTESKYGEYCGLYHYNNYGAKPINEIDRACQIHDNCVTGFGMMKCYCTQQLIWYAMNINPGPRGGELYNMRQQTLFAMGTGDNFCDNELHSYDKWFGLGGRVQDKKESYGFQYHVASEGPKTYYYGMRNATYMELTPEQYLVFTKAVGDSSNRIELWYNLLSVTSVNSTILASEELHILNTTIGSNNTVVIMNDSPKENFIYHSDIPLSFDTYIPIHIYRSMNDQVEYDIIMAKKIMGML